MSITVHCVSYSQRLFITLLCAAVASCRPGSAEDQRKPVRPFLEPAVADLKGWDDIFEGKEINLELKSGSSPLLRIGSIVPIPNGNFFVADGRAKSVLEYDSNGHFVQDIMSGPTSFKISVLGGIARDDSAQLLLFDPDSNWVSVLTPPTYRLKRRYQLKGSLSSIIAGSDGAIFGYMPSVASGSFSKFDSNGTMIASAVAIEDKNLGIFHARVHNGGLALAQNGDLYGIEPTSFELIRFSSSLKLREVLRSQVVNEWMPTAKAFPSQLDAYDFTKAHAKWWDSFRHVGRPFALTSDLLLITVFDSHGLNDTKDYVNVVQTDGRIVGLGLPIPHSGRIVAAADGRLFVVRNAHLAPVGDTLLPLSLYEYRLRSQPLSRAAMRQ